MATYILQPRPLAGITALMTSVACLLASLAVLVISDHQPIKHWTWQPSVFLAVLSAVSNLCVRFALAQAIPTAWWYNAMNGGTIRQLQRQWRAGQGLFLALQHAMHVPGLAIAGVASAALVIIDGPLLQRTSLVVSNTEASPTTLAFGIVPELPRGWSGDFDTYGVDASRIASQTFHEYMSNATITADVLGCDGICTATVRGPGVVRSNCTTHTYSITKAMMHKVSPPWTQLQYSKFFGPMPMLEALLFEESLKPGYVGPEYMGLLAGNGIVTSDVGCHADNETWGTFTQTYCMLQSATLEYEVTVSGNTVAFAQSPGNAKLASVAANTHVDSAWPTVPLTFTALGYQLGALVQANVTLAPPVTSQQGDLNAVSVQSLNGFSMRYSIPVDPSCGAAQGYTSPGDDIYADFNDLMFRSGIAAAKASNTSQSVSAKQTVTQSVFKTDLRWFAGAAFLQVVAIAAIVPVYWGWWRVGIKTTMSPFEIAHLFGAPLSEDVNSAAGDRGIARAKGDIEVRLGVVYESMNSGFVDKNWEDARTQYTTGRLAVGEASTVARPRRGMAFDR